MQIHELNNFSGALGAGAYLAVDNGTDTGKVSAQEFLAASVQEESITRSKLAQNITDFLPIEYTKTKFEKDGGQTSVWYSIIPSEYKPKLCLANDLVNTVETATDNASRNHATIAINAGVFYTATGFTKGYLINNGTVLNDTNYDDGQSQEYLYADANGVLNSTGSSLNVTLPELQALNPKWALLGFYAIAKNGVFVATGRADDYYNAPRTFVGQDANGNYIVGVSSGRNDGEKGLSMIDIYNFCLNVANFTPYFLYNLDGGGSSAMIYNGTRVNTLTQGEDRKCANFLIWAKDDTRIENAFETTNPLANKIIDVEQYLYKNVDLMAKVPSKIKGISAAGFTDCNNVTETSVYVCGSATTNSPLSEYGFLITLRQDGNLVNQIAVSKTQLFYRELWLGTDPITATEWKEAYTVHRPIEVLSTAGLSDCNNVTFTSIFVCGSSTANFPINNYGFLITLRQNGNLINQIAMDKSHVYIREMFLNAGTPAPLNWREVYSLPGYTTATSGTNVSANTVQYAKSSNVVIVKCDSYMSAAISANSVLATGLPRGLISEQNGVIFKSGNIYRVKVTDSGELINIDELPSGYYKISLTYFSE